MKYYIQETVFDEMRNKTAASKAREDINEIAESMGFEAIGVEYDYQLRINKGFFSALKKLTTDWTKALSRIKKDDVVLIQFPLNHHPLGIARQINKIHRRGGKVLILIHDIDCLRMASDSLLQKAKFLKVRYEDFSILKCGDAIIAHNPHMIQKLITMGIRKEKTISLDLFDYLVHVDVEEKERHSTDPIIIAGTLRKGKAEYVYNLPRTVNFELYGVGYEDEEKDNIRYNGSFQPEELINAMRGSFGLVWDGLSSETCTGLLGEYLKINNPHKTSLYLAAGIPVIVWEQAAIASFVSENNVGIKVSRINDITDIINQLSSEEYQEMVMNARQLSEKVRNGHFARKAINSAISQIALK